jgi:hypothetical protein
MPRTLTLTFVLLLPAVGLAQGKLEQVRDAVDRPSSGSSSSSRDTTDDSGSSSSDGSPSIWGNPAWSSGAYDGNRSDGIGAAFLLVAAAPFAVPNLLLDPGIDTESRLTPYPYSNPRTGFALVDKSDHSTTWAGQPDAQWWSVRASAEGGSNFDGLDRLGLRLFLDTDTRFGLKSDWDYYSEKLPCGCRDNLWLGDVTATFRFVQNEWLMMTTGLGGRFLIDQGHNRGGFNFLYGLDAFPIKPVHLFASFDGGTLGHADLFRLRGGVGVNWTHFELFAGYDWVQIGGVNLRGPMAGLRLWF